MADKQKSKGRASSILDWVDSITLDKIFESMKINHATRKYWIAAVAGSITVTIIAIVMDFTLPMEKGALSMLRAVIALAAGIFYFMFGYSMAVYQSDARRRHYDDDARLQDVVEPYQEIRLRYSFRQRRRWSYPVIAVIVIIIAASWRSHLYIVFTGIALAITFAVIAFVHPTPEETVLMVNDREDPRDLMEIANNIEHNNDRKSGGGRRKRGKTSRARGKKR